MKSTVSQSSVLSTFSFQYCVLLVVLILPAYLYLSLSFCNAVVAYPGLWTGRQQDGRNTGEDQLLIGSPEYHYVVVETEESNYPAIRGLDNNLYFATLGEDGRFLPTNLLVGDAYPQDHDLQAQDGNLVSALQEEKHAIHAQCKQSDFCKWKAYQRQLRQEGKALNVTLTNGSIANIVVPFRFADHSNAQQPVISIEDLDTNLFNGPQLTVKDYFMKQSYSKLIIDSEILPWVTIPYTEEECAHRQSGLSKVMHTCLEAALDRALKLLSDGPTLLQSPTTTLTFVHSGYAAEFGGNDPVGKWYEDRIWSHTWELSTPLYQGRYALISDKYDRKNAHVNRVGVAVHELAQVLGAPTLHGEFPGYGLGYYDVMANPWGFDGTLTHCGSMSPYTKNLFGWVQMEEITQEGTYHLEESQSSNKVYVIRQGFPQGEYLIVENRQELGYDKGLSQPGLAIYHIDEKASDVGGSYPGRHNFPQDHYRVSLVQGDGQYDLERMHEEGDSGDLFHAGRFTGVGPDGVFLSDGSVNANGNGYPNTNSYQDGQDRTTGIVIDSISVPDKVMTFSVRFL